MAKGKVKLTPQELEQMAIVYERNFQGEPIATICKDIGLNRRTYYSRKESEQWKAFEKELTGKLVDNAYDGIMSTVILQAKKGSIPAAKLFLDVTGKLKSSRELKEEQENARLKGTTTILDLQSLKELVKQDEQSRKLKRVK